MGLGITRASIVSAVADDTGDDGPDAVVKIKRLINRKGPDFCALGTFPFLNKEISFDITPTGGTDGYKYSGATYLPTSYKRIVGAYIKRNNDERHYSLDEINVDTFFAEENPEYLDGMPDRFCIQLISSDYWQIIFNRKPDTTYTVYLTIEQQWTDLDDDNDETVITKPFYPFFVHFVDIARFSQQGDSEQYAIFQDQWDNPMKPHSKLKVMLSMLSGKIKHKGVKVDMNLTRPQRLNRGGYHSRDYGLPLSEDQIGYD